MPGKNDVSVWKVKSKNTLINLEKLATTQNSPV
jgi:hypothetical protein